MLTGSGIVFRVGQVLILLGFLGGCATAPELVAPAQQEVSVELEREQSAATESARVAAMVEGLLSDAESALAADRLMSPGHDNAYDRYSAVLQLIPDHPQAMSGLQLVYLRYLALARSAIAKEGWGRALTYLSRAEQINPGHDQVAELSRSLIEQRSAQQAESARDESSEGVFRLDASQLRKRAPAVVAELQAIAKRVQSTDETLVIVAPTDADGRWMYSQMKAAVPGFRLRGDIKLGRKVKVVLNSPIDVSLDP